MSAFPGSKKELSRLQKRQQATQKQEQFQAEKERESSFLESKLAELGESFATQGGRMERSWQMNCISYPKKEDCDSDPICNWSPGFLGIGGKCGPKDLKKRWISYTRLFCDPLLLKENTFKQEIIDIFKSFGLEPSDLGSHTEWNQISKKELCRFFGQVNQYLDYFDKPMSWQERAKIIGIPQGEYETALVVASGAKKAGESFWGIVEAVGDYAKSIQETFGKVENQ